MKNFSAPRDHIKWHSTKVGNLQAGKWISINLTFQKCIGSLGINTPELFFKIHF